VATVVFTFTYDSDTKKWTMVGNISAFKALQMLQRLLIDAARKEQDEPKAKEGEGP